MRSRFALALLGVLLVLPSVGATRFRAEVKSYIYLQPLGRGVADDDLATIRSTLELFTGYPVKQLPPLALPASTRWDKTGLRDAYRLLQLLERHVPSDAFRVVGVTADEMLAVQDGESTLMGGLAEYLGTVAVVTTRPRARLKQDRRHWLAKGAVHELGHTLGLGHCGHQDCLMRAWDLGHDLCPACRERVAGLGFDIPARPTPPWPCPERAQPPRAQLDRLAHQVQRCDRGCALRLIDRTIPPWNIGANLSPSSDDQPLRRHRRDDDGVWLHQRLPPRPSTRPAANHPQGRHPGP